MHEAPQHPGNQAKGRYLSQSWCWGFSQQMPKVKKQQKKLAFKEEKEAGNTPGRKDVMLTMDALAKVQGRSSHQKAQGPGSQKKTLCLSNTNPNTNPARSRFRAMVAVLQAVILARCWQELCHLHHSLPGGFGSPHSSQSGDQSREVRLDSA